MASRDSLKTTADELLEACLKFNNNNLAFTELLIKINAYAKEYSKENAH